MVTAGGQYSQKARGQKVQGQKVQGQKVQGQKARGITLLALAALLLHMLLPFYAFYPSPVGQGGQTITPSASAPLFGGKVLICTAAGFKLISLADVAEGTAPSPQQGQDSNQPHPSMQCPLCYVAAHGLATPPVTMAALSLPSLFEASLVAAHTDHSPLAAEARWYRLRTRSPPTAIG